MDNWEVWLGLGVAVLIAYAVLLWLGLVIWTYFDMRDRSHDGLTRWVATAAVFLFNIPGFFLYLIFRPHETLVEAYERRLEAEALKNELAEQRRACPTCRRPVRDDFLVCPYCRAVLMEPCVHCGRPLELSFVACPYCGSLGPSAATPAAPTHQASFENIPPPLQPAAAEPPPLVEPSAAETSAARTGTRRAARSRSSPGTSVTPESAVSAPQPANPSPSSPTGPSA